MHAAFELINVQCAGVTTVIQFYINPAIRLSVCSETAASVYGSIVEVLCTKQYKCLAISCPAFSCPEISCPSFSAPRF